MKILLLAATFGVAIFSATSNRGNEPCSTPPPPPVDMKQYWLVLLYKGPNRAHSEMDAQKIQNAHMATISRLAGTGQLIMAGPMGHDRDLRGIFLMDGKDSAAVAATLQSDSAILTGRLRAEVHPWWTAKGTYTFK